MSPALNPRRSWGARSLGSSGDVIPTTPTSIAEHPARLHKPSKYATPTQLACPPRSRYVWSGETATASRSPSFEGDSLAERHRHCGGGGGDYGGTNGALPGWSRGGSREQQQREYQQIGVPHDTQPRYEIDALIARSYTLGVLRTPYIIPGMIQVNISREMYARIAQQSFFLQVQHIEFTIDFLVRGFGSAS